MARTLTELLQNEKPEVVSAARQKADEILLNTRSVETKEHVEKTQIEVTAVQSLKKPT